MRQLSPIEMMIDKACGFDRSNPIIKREPIKVDDENVQTLIDACEALAAWAEAVDGCASADDVEAKKRAALHGGRALVNAGWW